MSSIITFYSYKGGVGRSMALANIAVELSKRNKKVLMVDWDLEAPGLERYFSNFKIEGASEGLLSLILAFARGETPDYYKYIRTIDIGNYDNPIYFLPSGRENDSGRYSAELEKFDWDNFFAEKQGGLHLEGLRNKWLKDFDLVLIDSRTGLSDSSGVCTIMLPDIIIPMFTANYQSLFGIRDIMQYIQVARQKLSIDRMGVTILPVPSRFGTRVEFKESQEWLDRIADILKDCFSDWLPKWIAPRYILEQVKIPQVDYFSFGEKLSVIEQGTADPEGMGYIYSRIADLLASEFNDIPKFIGVEYYEKKREEYRNNQQASLDTNNYDQDIFISYPRHAYQWVRELLLPALTEYLAEELGRNPKIFFDLSEHSPGMYLSEELRNVIEHSRVILFIFADTDLTGGAISFYEGLAFNRQVFPVLYKKSLPSFEEIDSPVYSTIQLTDMSSFEQEESIHLSTRTRAQFGNAVEKLAGEIAQSIRRLEVNSGQKDISAGPDINHEIDLLAREYENLRSNLKSGNTRTILMEGIVSRMKTKASEATRLLPSLINSDSPGKRLAAIATLHEKPDLQYVNWLAEHVGNDEKPFIGYQASVGLFIASRTLGNEHKDELSSALSKAIFNLNKHDFKDPNQVKVLNAAVRELNLK